MRALYLEKARLLARGLLESLEVVASIRQRLIDGDLPPEVECMLWTLAYGEPVDSHVTRTVSRRPTLTLARRISDDERQERISAAALRDDVEKVTALQEDIGP